MQARYRLNHAGRYTPGKITFHREEGTIFRAWRKAVKKNPKAAVFDTHTGQWWLSYAETCATGSPLAPESTGPAGSAAPDALAVSDRETSGYASLRGKSKKTKPPFYYVSVCPETDRQFLVESGVDNNIAELTPEFIASVDLRNKKQGEESDLDEAAAAAYRTLDLWQAGELDTAGRDRALDMLRKVPAVKKLCGLA